MKDSDVVFVWKNCFARYWRDCVQWLERVYGTPNNGRMSCKDVELFLATNFEMVWPSLRYFWSVEPCINPTSSLNKSWASLIFSDLFQAWRSFLLREVLLPGIDTAVSNDLNGFMEYLKSERDHMTRSSYRSQQTLRSFDRLSGISDRLSQVSIRLRAWIKVGPLFSVLIPSRLEDRFCFGKFVCQVLMRVCPTTWIGLLKIWAEKKKNYFSFAIDRSVLE